MSLLTWAIMWLGNFFSTMKGLNGPHVRLPASGQESAWGRSFTCSKAEPPRSPCRRDQGPFPGAESSKACSFLKTGTATAPHASPEVAEILERFNVLLGIKVMGDTTIRNPL